MLGLALTIVTTAGCRGDFDGDEAASETGGGDGNGDGDGDGDGDGEGCTPGELDCECDEGNCQDELA